MIVGRSPRRTPSSKRCLAEWSQRALSDMDGQAAGRVSGSERVKRPTIIVHWTFGVGRWTFAS